MMSFCRRSVHSFLGLNAMDTTTTTNTTITTTTTNNNKLPWKCQQLGLITATGDPHRLPNVIESAAIIKSSSSQPSSPPWPTKKDPGGIGFIDDMGGGVDGLMSCTESLGFESSDERRADDDDDDIYFFVRPWTKKWRKMGERREVKKFPPPLSSLNRNGQPSFFLRPQRKDGRLELTEVRINRPEILRAYREDGRLRLQFIVADDDTVEQQDCIHEEEEEEEEQAEETHQKDEEKDDDVDETEEEEKEQVKGIMEEDRNIEDWKFPVSAGEGIRRCHEVVPGHHHHRSNHHHHMPVWSQHCVTTR